MRVLLAETPSDPGLLVLLGVLLAAAMGLLVWALQEQKKRIAIEQRFMMMQNESGSEDRETAIKRNELMFAQQKELNDLMIAKLKGEVAILEAQLGAVRSHPDREEAGKEAHELMVEKTKLEIDGLRLHNAEARKRMEDWTGE